MTTIKRKKEKIICKAIKLVETGKNDSTPVSYVMFFLLFKNIGKKISTSHSSCSSTSSVLPFLPLD
jgi:hypothetical protein